MSKGDVDVPCQTCVKSNEPCIVCCRCCFPPTRKYYNYYDTPDGQDVEKKVGVTTRYGIIAGMLLGTADVLMYSRAQGTYNVMMRYLYHVGPLAAMGLTFPIVATTAQYYRDSNDVWNYFLGGLACGPILAFYVRSYHGIVPGGIVLGIIGMIKKTSIDSCVLLFPPVKQRRGYITGPKNDFTFVKDPRDILEAKCAACEKSKKRY